MSEFTNRDSLAPCQSGDRATKLSLDVMVEMEARKRSEDISDENGVKICSIDFDPKTGKVLSVEAVPYINAEGTAEHYSEHVYVTDEQGQITDERATRKEARKQGSRYLIVTTLLFHGDRVVLQHRSAQKELDPDKLSHSAHGVAKELQINGKRIENVEQASVINAALELNEELRCGEGAKPFKVKIWYGGEEELLALAARENYNDSDTVYLIPVDFLPDDGYPLGNKAAKRTRSLFKGYVFSAEPPELSIDLGELSEVQWKQVDEITGGGGTAGDLQTIIQRYF